MPKAQSQFDAAQPNYGHGIRSSDAARLPRNFTLIYFIYLLYLQWSFLIDVEQYLKVQQVYLVFFYTLEIVNANVAYHMMVDNVKSFKNNENVGMRSQKVRFYVVRPDFQMDSEEIG